MTLAPIALARSVASVGVVAALCLTASCADSARGASGWRDTEKDLIQVQKVLRESLLDPGSAYFTDVKLVRYRVSPEFVEHYGKVGLAVCGWVRGRNALGGMQGPVAFVYQESPEFIAVEFEDYPPIFAESAHLTWFSIGGDEMLSVCGSSPDVISSRPLDWGVSP